MIQSKTTLGKLALTLALTGIMASNAAWADTYKVDSDKKHAFITFKVSHLGYSYVVGSFDKFTGQFDYDPATGALANVQVAVDVDSVYSAHGERDKHLRSKELLDSTEFPQANFQSIGFENGVLKGNLTAHGTTLPIEVPMTKVGEGKDPWGGYRIGFEGKFTVSMKALGIERSLGEKADNVELTVVIEGIKQ